MALAAPTLNGNDRPNSPVRHKAAAMIGLAILLACASSATADLFLVNTLADGDDGTCEGHCTLREAIAASNSNPGLDYITIPAGVLSLSDAFGPLNIWDSVFFAAQGQEVTIIDGSGLGDRVLEISVAGGTVWISSLTIAGGSTPADGGGILILDGHLSLSAVTVRDCSSGGLGGGINSGNAQLTVKDASVITRNAASPLYPGGGIFGSDVTITDSTISSNTAGAGGGVFCNGALTISGSTISDNISMGYDGGGLLLQVSATADISNTTIVGNHSGRMGGAVYADSSWVTLDAVTLSDNTSVTGASLYSSSSHFSFTNNLIAGDCINAGTSTFSTGGGNLESPGDTCGLVPGLDLIAAGDPMLGPLANNGGPTPTVLPQVGSPAIDNGSNVRCYNEDQRGEPRSDGLCDIGAVERQPFEPEPIFVDGFESGSTSAWQ